MITDNFQFKWMELGIFLRIRVIVFGVFVLSAGLNPGLDFSINIMENGAFDFFFFNLWGSGICTLGLSVGW